MSSTPSKLTLLQQIIKYVHFEPHKAGAVMTHAGLESLQMFVGKIGPTGYAGIRVEAAEPVNRLADSIFSKAPYQRGTTFPAVHKQLTDTIIVNYAGKANASIDAKDVAFNEQIAVHEFYIPCFISPWYAAAFSIGPVRFAHVQDFAPVAQAQTGQLHELTFKPVFDLMGRTRAQWIATVKIDGCTMERAQEIADLAVDVALAGLQVCLPEHDARHMARMTGRTMPTFGQAVARSNDRLLSATTNSEPGLTFGQGFLDKHISAARPVLDSVGKRLDRYVRGGGLTRLEQAWPDAAYWFHEALAEPLDTIAVPKLETALEVLLRAESAKGSEARVVRAIGAFYGKKATDVINPQSQTTVQQFARGFVRDRSRILHGTWSTLTHSLRAGRPTLTTLTRDLLILYTVALDQYAANPSATDAVDAFLDFVDAQRQRAVAQAASAAASARATP
jgi:hypothetical protein